MNAEIAVLQNELTIAKQNNQILELRHQLQVTQAQKASKLEDSLFAPGLYEHYQKVAIMMSKSEIVPKTYIGKPADIFIAMEMGYQLGFPIAQSLQDIAVINGRPCLWGDGLLALVLSHPDCEGVDEEPIMDDKNNIIGYTCIVKRRGFAPRHQTFTIQDASNAGLLKKAGPWTQYPKRMLQMRARAFALRDVFGDALRGFKVAEEQQDASIIDVQSSPMPTGMTNTEKLKQLLGIGEENVEKESDIDTVRDHDSEPHNPGHGDIQPEQNDGPVSGKSISNPGSSDDNLRVSAEQLDKIKSLFKEKGFDHERIERAFSHFKVKDASELSEKLADEFITKLEKIP